MKPEETIDYHIRWTWHAIKRMYNEEASKYGFSMSAGYVLLNIDMIEGTPSTQLGPKMGMESTSLSRTLKNLEQKGLIKRKANPKDGRSILICLTKEGKTKRKIARKKVVLFNNKLMDLLPNKKIESFFEILDKTRSVIKTKQIY